VPSTAGANHNTVFGMQFQYLGSKWSSAEFAYGGVYLAHGSSRNSVTGNQFAYITGVAMRTRNQSDANDITGNTFTRAGVTAFYSEWFCDSSCVADNPGHPRECSSHGNAFHDNDTVSGYDGPTCPGGSRNRPVTPTRAAPAAPASAASSASGLPATPDLPGGGTVTAW
jgi:hypothetical protein